MLEHPLRKITGSFCLTGICNDALSAQCDTTMGSFTAGQCAPGTFKRGVPCRRTREGSYQLRPGFTETSPLRLGKNGPSRSTETR